MKRFALSRIVYVNMALSLSLLLATACKKEEDATPGETKPSCLLTKEIRSQGQGASTIIAEIEYDASGRIKATTWTGSDGKKIDNVYERNSANKVSKIVNYRGTDEFYNSVFEYDAQGRWVKTTSSNIPLTQYNDVIEAEYDSQGRIIQTSSIRNNSAGSYKGTSSFQYTDGNLTKRTVHGASQGQINQVYEYEYYTDQPAIDYEYHQVIGYLSGSGSPSKNLVKKQTSTRPSDGYTIISEYTYEFNDKGFPTKITIQHNYNGTASATTEVTRSYLCE